MCGIFGVYSLLNEYIDGGVVIKALAVMRERGTRYGAGVALYAPSPYDRVKFFAHVPPPDAAEVYKLPSGVYDVTKYGNGDVDGVICGAGDADEPAPRPYPAGGNIYNHRKIPLAGKRFISVD
jgi:hypothetical protein